MSSILTNNGAMIALQTLKTINSNLNTMQDQISTGKKVATARDNAALWAISSIMQSDVRGFQSISESLNLGSSTVVVGRSAAEQVNELLQEVKQKVVAAQEDNVDRSKIQSDIVSLRDQIASIVGAAQFNGLNLLSNRATVASGAAVTTANVVANAGSADVGILSSLDRSANGTVTSSSITVGKQDLGTQDAAQGSGTDLAATAFTVSGAAAANGGIATLTVVGDTGTAARAGNRVLAGDSYAIGGLTGVTGAVRYVARDGDTVNDIAAALAERINFQAASSGIAITASVSGAAITLTNNTTAAVTATSTLNTGGTVSGGLELLGDIDVSTEDGAAAALGAMEKLIQTATSAAATLGTSQKRTEIQNAFVGNLIDSLKSGIGALVDANMEEASARLQALQVQQQLGIQALSIANQSPQNVLALFR